MVTKKPFKYTEQNIQELLSRYLYQPNSILYDIDNVYAFNWESDKLLVMKSGYAYEFEIKVARKDYEQDFTNKQNKHIILNSPYSGERYLPSFWEYYERNKTNKPTLTVEQFEESSKGHIGYFVSANKLPNKFFYAVPAELVRPEEVPVYAGLVWVTPYGAVEKKKAPFLHKTKYTDADLKLTSKFYARMVSYREKMNAEHRHAESLQEKLDNELSSIGQEMTYDDMKEKLSSAESELERLKHMCKMLEEDNEIMNHEKSIIRTEYDGIDFAAAGKEAMERFYARHPEKKPKKKKDI